MIWTWMTSVVGIVLRKTTLSISRIVIPIMVMLVLDMVFKTATLSPNVNIKVPLKRHTGMMKRLMVMWVVDMFFKSATLSPNEKIQLTLRISIGVLKIVMLVVNMVLWTSILIHNIMVWNNWWMIIIVMIQIWMIIQKMEMLLLKLVY